ncbi:MAG: hypothetical protein V1912_09330, partial [bacterium]
VRLRTATTPPASDDTNGATDLRCIFILPTALERRTVQQAHMPLLYSPSAHWQGFSNARLVQDLRLIPPPLGGIAMPGW